MRAPGLRTNQSRHGGSQGGSFDEQRHAASGGPIGRRTSSCATELVCRDCGYRTELSERAFKCPACGEGLDIDYDYERATAAIAERGLEGRPWNVWRFEELLPITSADAQAGSASSPARRR